jgi:hypothetical protein
MMAEPRPRKHTEYVAGGVTPETSGALGSPSVQTVISVRRRNYVPLVVAILVVLAVIAGIVLWVVTHKAPWERDEPGRHYNRELRYSIKYPEGWGVAWRQVDRMEVAAPPTEGGDDAMEVSVGKSPTGEGADLDLITEMLMARNQRRYDKVEEVERAEVTLCGVDARRVVYTCELDREPLKVLFYCLARGQRVFVVSGRTSPEDFEKLTPAFEAAAASLITD